MTASFQLLEINMFQYEHELKKYTIFCESQTLLSPLSSEGQVTFHSYS